MHETACSSAKTSTFGINIVGGFVALCISAGSGYIRQPRWAVAKYIWPCAVTMASCSTRYTVFGLLIRVDDSTDFNHAGKSLCCVTRDKGGRDRRQADDDEGQSPTSF